MRKSTGALCAASVFLASCASTPPMTVHYYLPRADLAVTVKKTVSCDSTNTIFTVLSADHDTVYSASSPATDKDAVQQIELKGLDGFMSDADLGFAFTEDGRLKGMNVATTGEGGEIVKSAIALAAPIANGLPGLAMAGHDERFQQMERACAQIAMWGGSSKALTLTYVATIPFASPAGGIGRMEPDPSSSLYDSALAGEIGAVCWTVGESVQRQPIGMDSAAAPRGNIAIHLRQPAVARVEIDNWDQPTCGEAQTYTTDLPPATKAIVWSGDVAVPQHGQLYAVLIPKAAAFGKQNFTLVLSEAGTITALTYGKTNGVAQALGAAKAGEDSVMQMPTERAQHATEEMNAIAAQEKLARCEADHSKCG